MVLPLPWRRVRTLARAAEVYLPTVAHLTSYVSRRSEVRAWVASIGARPIDEISKTEVLAVRAGWIRDGAAAKTCNNRVATLHHIFSTLDLDSPCARIRPLRVPRTPPVVVPAAVIEAVDRRLAAAHRAGRLRTERTRARFLVLATTGRRPSEVMRAVPGDLDLERRRWRVRDGKGGWTPGALTLTESSHAAWRLFAAAGAWGRWRQGALVRTVRHVGGWPADLRLYHLRHSVGIAMSEAGIDLADVGAALGHRSADMTRSHYVPVSSPRLARAADALEAARPIRIEAGGGGQLELPFGRPDPARLAGVRGRDRTAKAPGLSTQAPGIQRPRAVDPDYRPAAGKRPG